jgi:hypothetical protein
MLMGHRPALYGVAGNVELLLGSRASALYIASEGRKL